MDWVSDTVSAFGQTVGIPGLVLDNDGYVLFALDDGGLLCLQDLHEKGADEVLVTVAKPLPVPHAPVIRKSLSMADYRSSPMWEMQLALDGEALRATVRIPRHSFVQSTLEEAVDALFEFHLRAARAQ